MNHRKQRCTINSLVFGLIMLFQQSAFSSWCNGNRYLLFDMPLSDRLTHAADAVRQASADIAEQTKRLNLDFETHNAVIQQQINTQTQQLGLQTIALCEAGQEQEFPLHLQHLVLQTKAELSTRLRLNLGLLAAQQKAQQAIVEQRQQLQKLAVTLQARHNSLAVLLAELNNNASTLQPPAAQQFVQSACLAVTESDDLLDQIELLNGHELLAETIHAQQESPVSDKQLTDFMQHCQLDPSANKGMFSRLFNKLSNWL
ncbi:MAG: hypothetical protein K0U68_12920 [Gammaproteobacteria bacterium]|nr:hypothetical protein [Gammaproteobacteria bacterium]